MAFAPNAPRLDVYDGGHIVAEIDRRRNVVTLRPKATSAIAWDVRKIALTYEIDDLLAFCESVGSKNLRKDDESWFYAGSYIHGLWYNAPMRRMTQAQAAARIFAAKDHLATVERADRCHGIHDGAFIGNELIAAAIVGRVVEDLPQCDAREAENVIGIDFAYEPYVRPGDIVEYYPYEHQHTVRPRMMVLCATLPEDLDPRGAKVEPLFIDDDQTEPGNFEGVAYLDRKGNVIPANRRRKIGVAVAYTPRGGERQHSQNGVAFRWNVRPEERTTFAPHMIEWRRDSGRFHLWHSYDSMTVEDLDFFLGVTIGSGGGDRDRWRKPDEEIRHGIRFGQVPSWCPFMHTGTFVVTKDAPTVGQVVYAAWEEPYESHPQYCYLNSGLAVLLDDGQTFACGHGATRKPASGVRVVGHLKEIGFDARTEDPPLVDVGAHFGQPEPLKVAA